MERFIQLNLHSDGGKTEAANLPEPERKDLESSLIRKRLNRVVNKATHKASKEFARSGSGIFSK